MHALITSFLMVVLGEMGDKSQLLAMAFASRFRASQVMFGVLLATSLNHALAVAAGTYLASFIPMSIVSIIAGVSFLFFGLWTLRGDTLGDEAKKESRFGPLLTVTLAFFLAEMGDKTQLATIALAADYRNPVPVLIGTTSGMVLADGLGVLVGDLISRKISPRLMELLSAGIFIVFGFITLFRSMSRSTTSYLILGALALVTGAAAYWFLRKEKDKPSPAAEDDHAA